MKSANLILLLLVGALCVPPAAGACSSPTKGCLGCDSVDNTSCNMCDAGYQLVFTGGVGACSQCAPGTGRAADTVAQVADTTCGVTCDPSCKFCAGTSDSCLGCYDSYQMVVLGGKGICVRCVAGKGRSADSEPKLANSYCNLTCNLGCESCAGSISQCTYCSFAYYLSAPGTCTMCPPGTSKNYDVVLPTASSTGGVTECSITCYTGCKLCTGPGQNQCLNCIEGFYSDGAFACLECPDGYTKSADTQITPFASKITDCTVKCDGTCPSCTGPASNQCRRCINGYYMSAVGTCTPCPTGSGKVGDSAIQNAALLPAVACNIKCSEGCQVCRGPGTGECLSCKAGFYFDLFFNQGTCYPCPFGKGKGPDSSVIMGLNRDGSGACSITCASGIGCRSCTGTGATDCIGCMNEYYLNAYPTGSCSQCSSQKYVAMATIYPQSVQSSAVCSNNCDPSCKWCSTSGAKSCSGCGIGYRRNSDSSCTQCPAKKGKLADPTPVDFMLDTACTIDCDQACLVCGGTTSADCGLCDAGFYRSASTTCSFCPNGYGKPSDGTSSFNSIAISTTAGVTECSVVCAAGCRVCGSTTSCNYCDAGFYFVSATKCQPCPAGKGKIQDSTYQSSASTDAACTINCDATCLACKGTAATDCVLCPPGRYLSPAGTCEICPTGLGKAADTFKNVSPNGGVSACTISCQSSTCLTCGVAGSNTCLSCKAGFFLSSSGTCDNCPTGKGRTADTTLPVAATTGAAACTLTCDSTCSGCVGTASTDCVRCPKGRFLTSTGTCQVCSNGKGKDEDSTLAVRSTTSGVAECSMTCYSDCISCYGTTSNACLSCKAGFYLSTSNICTTCNLQKGKLADTTIPVTQNTAAACTITCASTCQSCVSTTATDCIRCPAGRYLSTTGACQICPSGFGKAADTSLPVPSSTSGVTECNIVCAANCVSCSGPGVTECLACAAGYYFTNTGSCQACTGSKGKVADSTLPVIAIPPARRILLIAGPCNLNCDATCETCSSTAVTGCLRCPAARYLSSTGTCVPCADGKGKSIDSISAPAVPSSDAGATQCSITCDAACLACSSTTMCLKCRAGYYLSITAVCTPCGPNTGKAADTNLPTAITSSAACSACEGTCLYCSSTTAADCLGCDNGKYLSSTGTCVTCALGTGKTADSSPMTTRSSDSGSTECNLVCSANCASCSGTSASSCLGCRAGYFKSGTSCMACDLGTGKAADASTVVSSTTSAASCSTSCDTNCQTCSASGPGNCVLCRDGTFMSAAGVCSLCPTGTGKPQDTLRPTISSTSGATECSSTCHESCIACKGTSSSSCVLCAPGYYLSAVGVCSPCGFGLGKGADTNLNAAPTTSAAACTLACHPSCQTCSAALDASACILCRSGYYMSAAGTCTMCPVGKGKIADASKPVVSSSAGVTECSITCHSSCRTCDSTSATGCLNCADAYWWAGSGTCTACSSNTKLADKSITVAATTESAACTTLCTAPCKLCSEVTSTYCLSCLAGSYFSAAGTCTSCDAGRGKSTDIGRASIMTELAACIDCHSSCQSCSSTSQTACITCVAGYYTSAANTCSMCPPKFGKPADSVPSSPSIDSGKTECGLACDNSCLTCSGTGVNNCVSCPAGSFYSAAGTCSPCDLGYGKPADTVNQKVVLSSASACTSKCHESCLTCKGATATDCLKCRSGYYKSAAGTCTACAAGKGKPSDLAESLPSTTTGATECSLNCIQGCINCATEAVDGCINCRSGYWWAGSGVCTQCPSQKGKAGDTNIGGSGLTSAVCDKTCDSACLTCSAAGSTSCLSCEQGYFLSAVGVCSMCPPFTGKVKDTVLDKVSADSGTTECAIKCDKSCRTCNGPLATNCLNCAAGYFLSAAGTCSLCAAGQGKPDDTIVTGLTTTSIAACTSACHASCSMCKGPASTDCLNCAAGYYLSAAGTCTMCAFGKGKVIDTTDFPSISTDSGATECSATCHQSCRTCNGPLATNCLNCAAGYFLSAAGTCSLCDAGQGKPEEVSITGIVTTSLAACLPKCHASCSMCKGSTATDCLNCAAGYYLSAVGTCTMCPFGTGKVIDTPVLPTISIDSGATECSITCHKSCRTCKGPLATNCLNCAAGYFLSAAGTCTVCPDKTGKDDDTATITAPLLATAACTVTCDASCRVCKNSAATGCLSCAASFFKSAAGTCSLCTATTGKPADPEPNSLITTQAACTATCDSTCDRCTGSTSKDCLRCIAGYYMSTLGVCTMCSLGTGKLVDSNDLKVSTTNGVLECSVTCDKTCRTCSATGTTSCLNCVAGNYWVSGTCTACPDGKGKPTDTTIMTVPQKVDSCTVSCHAACQTCSGATQKDCASCSAGYWWGGSGACNSCPTGRGKPKDTDLFPKSAATAEACSVFCDVCTSGCNSCVEVPTLCASCVQGRYLTSDQKCPYCSDNCINCESATKCTACATNYALSADGSKCTSTLCLVKFCSDCSTDLAKCSKCKDSYTLKSDTECILISSIPTTNGLSAADSPSVFMNVQNNSFAVVLGPTESKTVSAITVQDRVTNTKYTCAQLKCSHSVVNDKLSVTFDTELTIPKATVTIERSDSTVAIRGRSLAQRLLAETYPLVIDNVVIVGSNNLKPASQAIKIAIGILRLPVSLAIFWHYPHLAMAVDVMVNQLKMYSLLGEPYMGYVELVFQIVSDSKILPFTFTNPFESWDSQTLSCDNFMGVRSKGLYCSFFDNYGQNTIGLVAVGLLCILLSWIGRRWIDRPNNTHWQKQLLQVLARDYGWRFWLAKVDANHLEILLYATLAFLTADSSSKSVIGIILSAAAVLMFGWMAVALTKVSMDVWDTVTSPKSAHEQLLTLPNINTTTNQVSPPEDSNPVNRASADTLWSFAFQSSDSPTHAQWINFHAGRYLRAVLLVIFVLTIQNSAQQAAFVIVLESFYLAHLLVLDLRGNRMVQRSLLVCQAIVVVHLILRGIATSKRLSDSVIHTSFSSAIASVLIIYISLHMILALAGCYGSIRALFVHEPLPEPEKPSNKLQIIQAPEEVPPALARDDIPEEISQQIIRNEISQAEQSPHFAPDEPRLSLYIPAEMMSMAQIPDEQFDSRPVHQ